MNETAAVTAVDALTTWLGGLAEPALERLLQERDLPQAAGYTRITTWRQLAAHVVTGESVGRALDALTAGQGQLLGAVAQRAVEVHGPVEVAGPRYAWQPVVEPDVEPFERLLDEGEVTAWLVAGGNRAEELAPALAALRERALVLPAPPGRLAVPGVLHVAASGDGEARPADRLLTAAFNAPEVKRIAATLGLGEKLTRQAAQDGIVARLKDADWVRATAASAPEGARELLDRLVSGPSLLRTHCFTSRLGDDMARRRYASYGAMPDDKYLFRDGGSGDEGTDWLAARGFVVPCAPDTVQLAHEVYQALSERRPAPRLALRPPALKRTVPLPGGWREQGGLAAAAAAWRAELVLRELAAHPVAIRKAGGIAVRETRRLAKAAGASEPHTRLWLDLAVHAGLAAPKADEPATPPRGGRGRSRRTAEPKPPARLLASERYDAWAQASPAGRLLPLITAWAVVPEAFTYWPEDGDTPVALITPDDPYAVPLRRGLLCALAALPDGHGLAATSEARAGLLDHITWHEPGLAHGDGTVSLAEGATDLIDLDQLMELEEDGDLAGLKELAGQLADSGSLLLAGPDLSGLLDATLAEAELLGLVAHGALTPAGRAVHGLLEAGADRHFPAVAGAAADPEARGMDGLGDGLAERPDLASAVAQLRTALHAALPAPTATARFQADSTATVTGAPSAPLAELLAAVADIESEGHAVVWRITPVSLRRALDAGHSADELIARLTEVCEPGTSLPQPLTYTIKDSARTHGRLRVVSAGCCVRSDDTSLIAEVAAARGLGKVRLTRIAPTVLLSSQPPEETLTALRAAGYAPVQEASTGTTVLERPPAERSAARLVPIDQAHPQYGEQARGIPSSARELARGLRA
ncbi:helicase-associated domain-containing protein [Streptomyces sp. NPDC005480]|uniref:helicase-associated domain-containing protein n=1 Tax=Streptomyces sp. NPDC005480 TaxID=3154880 RepID=UPI0033BED920